MQGHTLALADYRGKVVLLDFWATWCAPCREETPRLVALQEKYRQQRFQIIGISLDDDAAPVRAFRREMKMNYPVAVGNAALAERYGGILGLPVAFLIDCHGRIRARWDGEIDVAAVEREIQARLRDCGAK